LYLGLSPRRRPGRGRPSPALAALLLALTLWVGTAEAWHAGEGGDEEHCVDCALCDIAPKDVVAESTATPESVRPAYARSRGELQSSVTVVTAERRPDSPRAPPV